MGEAESTPLALVTGSTSGIGRGIAESLREAGIRVIAHGIEPEAAGHGFFRYLRADLRDPEAVTDLVRKVEAELGPVEILVNNAGIQHVAPVEDFSEPKWNEILAVNLTAPFLLSRAVWPAMRKRRFGRILNIASVHGVRASELKSAYVAAKHGLIGLTKTLALEGAPLGITANALCPGYVMTPLVTDQIRAQAKAHGISEDEVSSRVFLRKQAIKAFIPVETVTEMARFLVSREAATITGASFLLDGGWTAQ